MTRPVVYILGALKNPTIPDLANAIESLGCEAFCDWFSPGPDADSHWAAYEQTRGRTYIEAINGPHAWHIFKFDKFHLDRCNIGVLVAPFGKSACTEMGYLVGQGKPVYILFDEEPSRYDLMLRFATDMFIDKNELLDVLHCKLEELKAGYVLLDETLT